MTDGPGRILESVGEGEAILLPGAGVHAPLDALIPGVWRDPRRYAKLIARDVVAQLCDAGRKGPWSP